jgi:hypothetical protein
VAESAVPPVSFAAWAPKKIPNITTGIIKAASGRGSMGGEISFKVGAA